MKTHLEKLKPTLSALLLALLGSGYVEIEDYQKLKSDFYSMQTMSDFQSLNDHMRDIADAHSLKLH